MSSLVSDFATTFNVVVCAPVAALLVHARTLAATVTHAGVANTYVPATIYFLRVVGTLAACVALVHALALARRGVSRTAAHVVGVASAAAQCWLQYAHRPSAEFLRASLLLDVYDFVRWLAPLALALNTVALVLVVVVVGNADNDNDSDSDSDERRRRRQRAAVDHDSAHKTKHR